MILKDYQTKALDQLESYFRACHTSGDPARAYESVTREWRGFPLQYVPLGPLPQTPYVCLRIPTGGGKTLIGGLAIERANRSLLFLQHSLTLWLVPSEPIREQTLSALRDPQNLLHREVFSALGEVEVMGIEEALRMRPHVLKGANVIIVATMQSFKQADTDRLNVYKRNSDMQSYFEGGGDVAAEGNGSLADVIRSRHPFVVVDEAHNQGTLLAFDTLARLEPAAILELTATPDRRLQPSNVVYSVSAASLQAEEMIKMPIEVVRREQWRDTLRDAIGCLDMLQRKADEETRQTGEYLRPIILIQAERKDAGHETLVPETVKRALVEDFGIAEAAIAIATGTQDDLSGQNVLSRNCPVRFIITVDKLREGWDCPFAYVLCSFRNTTSATAAEQILGRILRMPYAKRKGEVELNQAYAFVTSSNFTATVESLRDGLVRSGFERQEADDFLRAHDAEDVQTLFDTARSSVTYDSPEMPQWESLPPALAEQVETIPEEGKVTLRGSFTETQKQKLESAFQTEEGKQEVRIALAALSTKVVSPRTSTPSERGIRFEVPLLSIRQADLFEPFEETHLLEGEWSLSEHSPSLNETEFSTPSARVEGGRLVMKDERVSFESIEAIERQSALFDFESGQNREWLVAWLERNIHDDSILPDDKAAFLNAAVTKLLEERSMTIGELLYGKFRLREALENKVHEIKRRAMAATYQLLLSDAGRFMARSDATLVFQEGRYAYDLAYAGLFELPKHFFARIGNLKSQGEEFECARFIATSLSGVEYWIRNVERKPTSFSLQTSTDRFYPDFLAKLTDGRILAVEYKGANLWDTPDSKEKRELGKLWQDRSEGRCVFVMVKDRNWAQIEQAL